MITFITSYRNNSHYIDNLLRSFCSLLHFEKLVAQVLVIDSNSDKPYLLPSSYPVPIRCIVNPKGTLTSSLNVGINECKTPWYAIFDADTEILSPNLLEIINVHSSDSLILPVSVFADGSYQECFDDLDTILYSYMLTKLLSSRLLAPYFKNKKSKLRASLSFRVNRLWNQCIFVNKSLVSDLYYNEDIYVWGCDFELSNRLLRNKIPIVVDPNYRIVHFGAGSEGGHSSIQRQKKVIESEFTYINIVYPLFSIFIHLTSLSIRFLFLLFYLIKPPLFCRKLSLFSYHFSLFFKG